MHFVFLPTFFRFFKKYNHFPNSVSYKYLKFSDQSIFRNFISLFIKRGIPTLFLKLFLSTSRVIWQHLSPVNGGMLKKQSTYLTSWIDTLALLPHIFTRFKFVFFFSFTKLNKYIYKYSNYRRPRYNLDFRYIPTYKRFKILLRYMRRSVVYYKGKNFKVKLKSLLLDLLLKPEALHCINFTTLLQTYLFKNKKFLMMYR